MKALLLVAHPDDEVLFAGGLMLAHPEIEWCVYTATHKANSFRGEQRASALAAFAARGVTIGHSPMLGLDDDGPVVVTRTVRDIWRGVLSFHLDGFEPDLVVTHNRMGEYGHPHHMALHSIAHELFVCPIWHFYCSATSGVSEQDRLPYDYSIDLTGGLATAKHEIMTEAYPDQYEGIRVNAVELIQWAFGSDEMHTSNEWWPS